jgi:cardiolipin synthase (CMP-forming)
MDSPPASSEPPVANVPNLLAAIRLVGSLGAMLLAVFDLPLFFLVTIGILMLTDWLDGKLAVLLDQRTTFGARLDSFADAAMYAAILFGCLWLKSDLIRQEAGWILVGLASYAVTSIAGWVKFGRIPSYHTRAAKCGWLLVGIAVLGIFTGPEESAWSVWPLRVAAVGVTLTNLEATAITWILPQWRADVPSVWHAWRDR